MSALAIIEAMEAAGCDAETIVRARVLDGGEWSALTEARFVAAVPGQSNLLAITKHKELDVDARRRFRGK